MTLQRSGQALANKARLYEDINEIHIYVEDTKGVHIHEAILKRIFPKHLKIGSIYPTGGKAALLDAYEKSKTEPHIPRLFIADADFDAFLGKTRITDDCLVYLQRYSIENYLIDENVAAAAVGFRRKCRSAEAAKLADFSAWVTSITEQYRPLMVLFIVAQKLGLPLANVQRSEGRYLRDSGSTWQVDPVKVKRYLKEVIRAYKQQGGKRISSHVRQVEYTLRTKYSALPWHAYPGKHLLRSLLRYLASLCDGKQLIEEDFVSMAVNVCHDESLVYIRKHAAAVLSRAYGKASNVATLFDDTVTAS